MIIDETLSRVSHVENQGTDSLTPRYDLSPEELGAIEASMVEDAKARFGETVSVAWVSPEHPYCDFLRTHEARYFPEVVETDPEYDLNQVYLAIVDTRSGQDKVVHAASVMRLRSILNNDGTESSDRTGLYTVDSLIGLGNFTKEEFLAFYRDQGIELDASIAVETNFKITDNFEPFFGMGSSADLAYLTLFNTLIANNAPIDKTVVFATINTKQIKSLERVGIDVVALMGRTDFRTEEEEHGVFSMPVTILVNQKTHDIFSSLGLELPELIYGSPHKEEH